MISPMRIRSAMIVSIASMLPCATATHAKGTAMDPTMSALNQLVERFSAAAPIDRHRAERILGVPLHHRDSTKTQAIWQARDIRSGPLTLAVELRESVAGSGGTPGALLAIDVTSGCVHAEDVAAHYKPWTLTDIPRGRSLDEQTSWSREERWGRLSFGFAERRPECLASIVFEAKPGARA